MSCQNLNIRMNCITKIHLFIFLLFILTCASAGSLNKNDMNVCEYIHKKKEKYELRGLFQRKKFIKNGLFSFDLTDMDRYEDAKYVIVESVMSTKYNLYIANSEVVLNDKGNLRGSTILSNSSIELVDSAEFIIFDNSVYILTDLSDLFSGKNIQAYGISGRHFYQVCK